MPSGTYITVTDLVGSYLQQISFFVARPFSLEFQPREVDFCLEEVVRSYREQWDSLVNSLVDWYFPQVSPGLAEEFREQALCMQVIRPFAGRFPCNPGEMLPDRRIEGEQL